LVKSSEHPEGVHAGVSREVLRKSNWRGRAVAAVLILVGGALALGTPSLVRFIDGRAANVRLREADVWIQRHAPTSLATAPVRQARRTVITPGTEGYLLEIPKIGLRAVVRELEPEVFSGRNTPALKRFGLGQVPYTRVLRNVSPGAEGTAAIAGHRTTSGAPFRNLDRLARGDIILIRKAGLTQQWVVVSSRTVSPRDVNAIKSQSGSRRLVILACTPPFSAKERLLVYARLVQETARSAAVRLPE